MKMDERYHSRESPILKLLPPKSLHNAKHVRSRIRCVDMPKVSIVLFRRKRSNELCDGAWLDKLTVQGIIVEDGKISEPVGSK